MISAKIELSEHYDCEIMKCEKEDINSSLHFDVQTFSSIDKNEQNYFLDCRQNKIYPYSVKRKDENIFVLKADYYIGLDWLVTGKKYVNVVPKINAKLLEVFQNSLDIPAEKEFDAKKEVEDDEKAKREIEEVAKKNTDVSKLDYIKMLLDVYAANLTEKEIGNLVTIYWDTEKIKIEQKEDQLTPFLVVQFLNLLKSIVRKGLKKSYYKVQENLTNKVKGKILVGTHIKQNIFKNRMTKTFCEYQVFGEHNTENKFLKKVFQFCTSYVQNSPIFTDKTKVEINNIINYCRPAFELIKDDLQETQLHHLKYNPFFKEYKEAIKIGNYILKQFAYNISSTSANEIETPPFWIDMPRLFELYFYQKLLKANNFDRGKINYQFSTFGNSLDFFINNGKDSIVIDTKYKLHYKRGHIHSDIRQVSGYARLRKVRNEVKKSCPDWDENSLVNCLIIYPEIERQKDFNYSLDFLSKICGNPENEIKAYQKVYKLGIALPMI